MIASSISVLLYQALRKFLKVATSYYPPYKNIYLFAVLELWLIVYRLAFGRQLRTSEPPDPSFVTSACARVSRCM